EPRLPDLLGQGELGLIGITPSGTDYYKQQRQVLASYTLIQQTVRERRLITNLLSERERTHLSPDEQLETATKRLQRSLSIKYPDQNRIMYVVIRNEDPELAAKIANDHVATYVAYAKGLLALDTKEASRALTTE